MSTYLISAAAAELGISPGRVRQLCAKYALGKKITSRLNTLSEKDMRVLRNHRKAVEAGRRPKILRKTVDAS